jgi:DNA polymerase III epsilon subunit-like protein
MGVFIILIIVAIIAYIVFKSWPKIEEGYSEAGSETWGEDIEFDESISKIGKYLILDIETTGLPKDRNNLSPYNIMNWPWIVQIAWIIFDKDFKWVESYNYIVKQKRKIPSEAIEIHGITDTIAEQEGVEIGIVLEQFRKALDQVDTIVAHNIDFDIPIIECEYIRNGFGKQLTEKTLICTMMASVNFCRIRTGQGYKWPKLIELYQKCFYPNSPGKIRINDLHNAFVDVHLTSKCFFSLKERGIITDKETAKIEYIKENIPNEDLMYRCQCNERRIELTKTFRKVTHYTVRFEKYNGLIHLQNGDLLRFNFWDKEYYLAHPLELDIRISDINGQVVGEINDRSCIRTLRAFFNNYDFEVKFSHMDSDFGVADVRPFPNKLSN